MWPFSIIIALWDSGWQQLLQVVDGRRRERKRKGWEGKGGGRRDGVRPLPIITPHYKTLGLAPYLSYDFVRDVDHNSLRCSIRLNQSTNA